MGTGKEQAELWGPGARDWSEYNEPTCTSFYAAVLDATGVGPGTRLLDAGCGGGFALLLAARRGATVSGFDITPALLDIARERVPAAALAVGDLEDALPFEAGSFDVVIAFNSVQFAADPVAAVKSLSQLARPGGLISLLVWGPPEQCESGVMFAELGPLLPPRPAEAPGAIAWSQDGQLGHLAMLAGLTPVAVEDVPNPLIYPDLATAVRTQLSSGPARAAIQHSGLPAVRGALTRAFAGSRQPDGTYRQDNVFRYLVART
jgi:SAM-dependent methyltransferase